ncbi:hypothetical protein, partial [Pseudomonas sp. AB12(2023)]|uniref:hypothetical protein n=1 Tax=Pseudomonas sp. AB12(2023) TaxID=3048597 RepID=UPI002B23AEA3
LNCVEYLPMKNTPVVGWVSNIWGAVQDHRFSVSRDSVGTGAPAKDWHNLRASRLCVKTF